MIAGTLERLVADVAGALADLNNRLQPDNVTAFFEQLGTRFPATLSTDASVATALSSATAAASDLTSILVDFDTANEGGNIEELIDIGAGLVEQVGTVLDSLSTIAARLGDSASAWAPLTPAEVQDFASNFVERALHDRLLAKLERFRPEFVSAGVLIGLIDRFEQTVVGAEPDCPRATIRRLRLDRFGAALKGGNYFEQLVGWGTEPFDPTALLERLEAFVNVFSYNSLIDRSVNPPVLYAGAMTFELNAAASPPGLSWTTGFTLPLGYSASIPLGSGYSVNLSTQGSLDFGTELALTPPAHLSCAVPVQVAFESRLSRDPISPDTAILLFGKTGSSRLEVAGVDLSIGFELASEGAGASGDFSFEARIRGGKAVIDFREGDGFLSTVLSGTHTEANFELAAKYSPSRGIKFEAAGALEIVIPLNVDFAGVGVSQLALGIPLGADGRGDLPLDIGVNLDVTLGPIAAAVQGIGLETDITFGDGNLGFGNIELGFKPPTGLGVQIDAGGVRGGGFLAFERNRYSGAVELSIFSVSVKAFGLVETVLPDGSKGFSFVIVIIAEFTPIQLGFGFTLLGVGGLIGVNRTVDADALGNATRTGALGHLLFPRNVVANASTIINDLATVFPGARGHFILAPLAKFGWGTPTLISAEFGVLLEFPGPRLGLLGVVRLRLPSPEAAVLKLQMAMAGLLDFPAKTLSVDAGLFDSVVVTFPVAGDMAFRLGFGSSAKFLMSVGGFNPAFDPPPGVPDLRRVSVDLGVNGNPSLVASGYFALTSNTAQIGASIELLASGAGIRLHGWFGMDAMFVFSPFSFTASFSAGMRVSFHGVGFGVSLRGDISGPNPWHVAGKVCVSILWWDACLSVKHTFGKKKKAALPQMDPWTGASSTQPDQRVIGLMAAIEETRNWTGSAPAASYRVVSLVASTNAERVPVDPMGAATFRQRVVPLQTVLTKFGEYRPIDHDRFILSSVAVSGELVDLATVTFVDDQFVPGHFVELSDAEKLSTDSYQPMTAGFTIDSDRTTLGSMGTATVEYETDFINAAGQRVADSVTYRPSQALLLALLKRSAAALGGVRLAGERKYIIPGKPKKVSFGPKRFAVVDSCSGERNTEILSVATSQIQAILTLRAHVATHPEDGNRYQVVPTFAIAS